MVKANKIFYLGILPGLIWQFLGAFLYFVVFPNGAAAQGFYSGTKILMLVWPFVWIFLGREFFKSFWETRLSSVLWGLGLGVLIFGGIFGVFYLFENYFLQFAPLVLEKVKDFNLLEYYITYAIFLSIVHSLFEEFYWRFFILKGLQLKFSPVWAMVISSLAFASHHFIVVMAFFPLWISLIFTLAIFGAGMIWCFIYLRTKSILGSWISHFFADVVIMYIGYLLIF